jgi:hypothetical protein
VLSQRRHCRLALRLLLQLGPRIRTITIITGITITFITGMVTGITDNFFFHQKKAHAQPRMGFLLMDG